ncbi:MAG TPA: ECF-type sigma factor [Terriglobales bacterium]
MSTNAFVSQSLASQQCLNSSETTAECLRGQAQEPETMDESYPLAESLDQFGEPDSGRDPDLWLYRERTIAILKRYLRISIEVGRLPSLLGRELFRSKVTSYRMSSFEDAVIFVHDVERALDQLDPLSKDLVALMIFQDYSQDEAAELLRCARRTICRQFPETVDRISEIFVNGGLLNRLTRPRPVENSCQEGESSQFSASDWK